MKKVFLVLNLLFTLHAFSQEKEIWAKSIINEKAPNLIVEKWLSDQPNTKGKFVLVDFWATWCGTHKTVIPLLNSFSKDFKDGLIVIGISYEREKKVNKLIEPKIEYYSAIDTRRKSYNLLKINGLPHCILLDPNGVVCWEGNPLQSGYELTTEVINKIITNHKNDTVKEEKINN